MESVLDPMFRNLYISDLENKIFNSIKNPSIYLRYLDDVFSPKDSTEINLQQDTFLQNPVLNFNHELNKSNKCFD